MRRIEAGLQGGARVREGAERPHPCRAKRGQARSGGGFLRSKNASDRRESIGWGWRSIFIYDQPLASAKSAFASGRAAAFVFMAKVSPAPPLSKGTVFNKLKTRLAGGGGLASLGGLAVSPRSAHLIWLFAPKTRFPAPSSPL